MIDYIKKKFIENPEKIVEFLEIYNYRHFSIKENYITFGRDEDSSPKSIVIRLKDNDACLIKDYARNVTYDIINFVIKCRGIDFRTVIQEAKRVLSIEGYYQDKPQINLPFGGFYSQFKKKTKNIEKTYDESILDVYEKVGNVRFYQDNISYEIQKKFSIGYCLNENVITIPIWNEIGELVGVKARRNDDILEREQKYFYLVPCSISNTLYGYWQNYSYLQNSTIWVFESEKSVMQCATFGNQNAVSIGSSSLSKKQAQMLLNCNPKRIILAHDKSLPYDVIKRNASVLSSYGRLKDFDIYYLDMENDDSIPDKSSPSDLGKDKFKKINLQCIKKIERNEL